MIFFLNVSPTVMPLFTPNVKCRMLELRRLEKEEEKRAREKIRQKLEEDKVSCLVFILYGFSSLSCVSFSVTNGVCLLCLVHNSTNMDKFR